METTRFERVCRSLVRPVAIVITCAWLLAEACYTTGRLLRLAIDDRSEQLADLHCWALGLTRTTAPAPAAAPEPPATAPAPAPAPFHRPIPLLPPLPVLPALPPVAMACAPAHRPTAIAAPPLATMTVTQLRTLARSRGHRGARIRNARRIELLQLLA